MLPRAPPGGVGGGMGVAGGSSAAGRRGAYELLAELWVFGVLSSPLSDPRWGLS